METIDLHGLGKAAAGLKLEESLSSALRHGERIVRIIHGQGKHSEVFPVIKSYARKWLEESAFASANVETFFRGEDGSPYTRPNAGETVVILRGSGGERTLETLHATSPQRDDEEEEREARRHAKGIRADRLRKLRRR